MAAHAAISETDRARPRRLDMTLLERRPAGRDFAWLTLEAPPDWHSLPGQFINVRCGDSPVSAAASDGRPLDWDHGWPRAAGLELAHTSPVVRRPLSVARLERAGGGVRLGVLVRAVGPGTRALCATPAGTGLDVVGPLGNHFTAPRDDRVCVVVGGGCGVAPIFGLADVLADAGGETLCFFGTATVEDMPVTFRREPKATRRAVEATDVVEEFARAGVPVVLATDDGSAGHRGPVTAALKCWLRDAWDGRPLALYGCGPQPMLRALAGLAAEHDLPCQVSLERWMGCGVGVCQSCAYKRRDPASATGWTYGLTCRDGPVVEARDLVWDEA